MDVERRQHWDTELIEATRKAIFENCFDHVEGPLYDQDVYAVIAAVEGWHKAKRDSRDRTHSDECWRWHQECAEALIEAQQARLGELSAQMLWVPDWRRRALKAEAQIQRAREVLNRWVYRPPVSLLDEVNRALDGDSDGPLAVDGGSDE